MFRLWGRYGCPLLVFFFKRCLHFCSAIQRLVSSLAFLRFNFAFYTQTQEQTALQMGIALHAIHLSKTAGCKARREYRGGKPRHNPRPFKARGSPAAVPQEAAQRGGRAQALPVRQAGGARPAGPSPCPETP